MDVRFWAKTDVGRTRDHNEDNFLVDRKLNLFVVADGMGGHAAGEVASLEAVQEVRRVIAEERALVESFDGSREAIERVTDLLERAISSACLKIFEMAAEDPNKKGMGTTTSLMLIAGERGFIGHVGDSRIYRLRDGETLQLTEDHSLINELIRRGKLQPGDPFDSPYKNAVTRAVGVHASVEVEAFDFAVEPGDTFLLCSDGLSCYLDDLLMLEYMSMPDLKEMAGRFIDHANASGGKDNITAVIVRALEAEEAAAAPRPPSLPPLPRPGEDPLRAVTFFKYLTDNERARLAQIAEVMHLEPNQVLFTEGDMPDGLWVVVEGRVALLDGDEALIELGAGGHFGESALVNAAPRVLTARAMSAARCFLFPRQAVFKVMEGAPILGMKLLWGLTQSFDNRLRVTQRELKIAQRGDERPVRSPAASLRGAMPITPSDELTPDFLFRDAQTSPPPFRDGGSALAELNLDI
ncbi:Stp1/IreP family PP2C-type Ser/Thr phosphatase [Myxococcota bacterium]|nr:Stp1/IreP family PP2C-type Ser/Thr phosphatase [Myxococcota bacterium]MBU1430517.1 Stp1/IreP family PP2C-type Ser/Thr phosphatase [Myxococcota bacterium]MBU1900148.1 Stp1/IreP family PP2C-type Ser/Thr phosphatase [Myxococcota bacterium]